MVGSRGVDSVLIGHHLPKLGADLVATLATLDVYELAHVWCNDVYCDGSRVSGKGSGFQQWNQERLIAESLGVLENTQPFQRT